MVTDVWQKLATELDTWAEAGRVAQFWWRDDDADRDDTALQKLLDLQHEFGVPLAIAAIGGLADKKMADRINHAIAGGQEIYLLSHGHRHENFALAGEKKNEFPNHRLVYDMLADIALGFEALKVLFGDRALPVFVPPWNRFSPGMVPRLQNAQIRGYSSFGAASDLREFAVTQVNCDIDIIDWRGRRGYIGDTQMWGQLSGLLNSRRENSAGQAIGILSHHKDHDAGCWNFLEKLFRLTEDHPAAHWQNPREAFNLSP
jgi:hypothetical protein